MPSDTATHRYHCWLLGLGLAMVALMGVSLCAGYTWVSPWSVWQSVRGDDAVTAHLLWDLRLPRTLIAPLSGAALAVSGLLLQTTTRNPLVAPDILGLNTAAATCVLLALWFVPELSLWGVDLVALLGAGTLACLLLVMTRATRERVVSPVQLPLLGSVLTLFLAAFMHGLMVLRPSLQDLALSWLTGNLASRELAQMSASVPCILLAVMLLWRALPTLDLFYLGDSQIRSLGYGPERLRARLLLICVLLTVAVVSMAGPIGFIGLLVPRWSRFLGMTAHRYALPLVALMGAVLLLAADIAARFVLFPEDVPVGAMIALIGGPWFLWLLFHPQGMGRRTV